MLQQLERINSSSLRQLAANEGVSLTDERLEAIAQLVTISVILDETRFWALFSTARTLLKDQFMSPELAEAARGERLAKRL